MHSRLLIFFFTLMGCAPAICQSIQYQGQWKPSFSVKQSFNSEDYILGFGIGAMTPSRNLEFYGSFDFRPYRKKIQENQGGNSFYQFAERRFFTGIGAEYLHRLNDRNKGFFVGVNGQYSAGNYGGTFRNPQKGFLMVPRAGLFMSFFERTTFLKLGYEYLDTKSEVLEHRFVLTLTAVIGPGQ